MPGPKADRHHRGGPHRDSDHGTKQRIAVIKACSLSRVLPRLRHVLAAHRSTCFRACPAWLFAIPPLLNDTAGVSRPHELRAFFDQVSREMADEYHRISPRVHEDPGTAGDEGESNWAELLSNWLPSDLHIVTKGRILGVSGEASPQIDVIVLSGDYPKKLLTKKLYMAGGVVAAFECKTTLRREHSPKLFSNAAAIRRIAGEVTGTIYDETFGPIIYGLLAHRYQSDSSGAEASVDQELRRLAGRAGHPLELPALVCVANLATWQKNVHGIAVPTMRFNSREELEGLLNGPKTKLEWLRSLQWTVSALYHRWDDSLVEQFDIEDGAAPPNPIAVLIMYLLQNLALADDRRTRMADYYLWTQAVASSGARVKEWAPCDVYSERLLNLIGTPQFLNVDRFIAKNRESLP